MRRLRQQLDGTRRAMASRAVIEQAKGILMARHRLDPDSAFAELKRRSQHENVKLARVAATLVATAGGQAAPEHDDTLGLDTEQHPPGAGPGGRQAEEGNAEPALAWGDPDTVSRVAGLIADGPALREPWSSPDPPGPGGRPPAGTAGVGPGLDAWRELVRAGLDAAGDADDALDAVLRWPAGVGHRGLPCCTRRSRTGRWCSRALVVSDPASGRCGAGFLRRPTCPPRRPSARPPRCSATPLTTCVAGFPRLPDLPGLEGATEAVAALPVLDAGDVLGVLVLGWAPPQDLSGARRGLLAAIGPLLASTLGRRPPVTSWRAGATGSRLATEELAVHVVLESVMHPAIVLRPVRATRPHRRTEIVDFCVEYANPAALDQVQVVADHYVGRTLVEVAPETTVTVLLPAYRRVLETGVPVVLREISFRADTGRSPDEERLVTISATRLGDRLVVTWCLEPVDERRLRLAYIQEELLGSGAWWWDLTAERYAWTPGLYRLLSRDPRLGPMSPDDVDDLVDPRDLPAVRDLLRSAVVDGRQLSTTIRVRLDRGDRRVLVRVRPLLDE